MGVMASQITSLTIVYSNVYSGADQRKHQSSASLAFVRVIHRGPVNSPHKWPVTRKMFPFDDVIMICQILSRDPFYSYELNLILSRISNCIHYKVWDEIIYPFPNFSGATDEVWEWISNLIPHFTRHVITYVSKKGSCRNLINIVILLLQFILAGSFGVAVGKLRNRPLVSLVTWGHFY